MIFLVKADESFSMSEEKLRLVPPERRERIQRFRFTEDKRASLICGLLIRYGAAINLGDVSENLLIAYGKYGKPYFPDYPGFYFSVSHTRECVVYTSADVPVGIDTERIVRLDETAYSIAKNFFTLQEYERLMQSLDAPLEFFRIWTGKEAFLKCTGEGLSRPLDSFSVYSLPRGYSLISTVYGGRIISLCHRGECGSIVIKELLADKLTAI